MCSAVQFSLLYVLLVRLFVLKKLIPSSYTYLVTYTAYTLIWNTFRAYLPHREVLHGPDLSQSSQNGSQTGVRPVQYEQVLVQIFEGSFDFWPQQLLLGPCVTQ